MKLDIEIDDHLDLEVGDSVIVIKKDGSVGKVIELLNDKVDIIGVVVILDRSTDKTLKICKTFSIISNYATIF